MAACVLTRMPQSFAVHLTGPPAPLRASTASPEVEAYTRPARALDAVGSCMVAQGFATNYAVAEASGDIGIRETTWWLIFLCGQATQLDHVQRWLDKRCQRTRQPPALSKVVHLTPLLQRRLLWGDARTTPAIVDSFTAELKALGWTESLGSGAIRDGFAATRADLTAQELLLRVPKQSAEATQAADLALPASNVPALPAATSTELVITDGFGVASSVDVGGGFVSRTSLALLQSQVTRSRSMDLARADACTDDDELLKSESDDSEDTVDRRKRGWPTPHEIAKRPTTMKLLSGRVLHESSDEPCAVALPVSEFLPVGRAIEGLTNTPYCDVDATEPCDVELPFNCRTIKVLNATPFKVWQPGHVDKLEVTIAAITRELDDDCSFERMLVKYGLMVLQAVPPYGGDFVLPFKRLLAKQRAQIGVSQLLGAREADILDSLVGLPVVTRCRVCCKPVDDGEVHAHCRVLVSGHHTVERVEIEFADTPPTVERFSEVTGCLCARPMPVPADTRLDPLLDLWLAPRCENCGECVFEHWEDAAERRPASSKVARKRAAEQ